MAMDVVSIRYETDSTARAVRICFSLEIPVPPTEASDIKALMDAGNWNGFKSKVKGFAPNAVSGAMDYLISVAPQKAAGQAPQNKSSTQPAKS